MVPKKEFFPKFVAIGKELDCTDVRKITQIYRRCLNLCNRLLICVIRSFPFVYGLKIKFLEKHDYFQLVIDNTCYKFWKDSKKALALLNMLVFVVLFTILSGVLLVLVSTHTRHMEHHIRRVKASYAAEAASVAALDAMRRGVAISNSSVDWAYDTATGGVIASQQANVSQAAGGINGTTILNSTCDYSISW